MASEGEEAGAPATGTRDYFTETAELLTPVAPSREQLPGANTDAFPAIQPASPPLAPRTRTPSPSPTPPPRAVAPFSRAGVVLALLAILCLAGGVTLFFSGEWFAPAPVTITVTPREGTLARAFPLLTVLHAPRSAGQILVQPLDTTASASATVSIVPVSVTAQAARGQVTLYNIAPYVQLVPAGSILTASGGIEFRTIADARVPAGNAPYQGSTSVWAQAVTAGANGNIPARSISMECCTGSVVNGIYALNESAFSGGQDAGPQYVVQQADIARAQAQAQAGPLRQAQQALGARVPPGARLVAAPACAPQVRASVPVGAHAQQVSVSVQVSCHGLFYAWQDAVRRVGALFATQAGRELGSHYRLLGLIALSSPVTQVPRAGKATLTFPARGTWAYLLDRATFGRLLPRIAGKRWADVRGLLEGIPGVGRVALAPAVDSLPADSQRISLAIASPPGNG